MLMLPDGTWYHSSDMDTKEIIRRIKDGAGWDDLKDLVPPISKLKRIIQVSHQWGAIFMGSPICILKPVKNPQSW